MYKMFSGTVWSALYSVLFVITHLYTIEQRDLVG